MHPTIFIFLVHTFPTTTTAHEPALEARQAGILGCTTFLHQLQEIVFGQPVALTTSITANTTFTGPYGQPITVTNAPTLLKTTYTAFSTTTSTSDDFRAENYQETPTLPGLPSISALPTGSPVIPPIDIPDIGTGTGKQGSSTLSSISTSDSIESFPPAVSPPSPSSTSGGGVSILDLNLSLDLQVASSVCGVAGSSPDGTCLQTLPPECRLLSSATLLGALIDTVDLLACQTALGLLGTTNAAICFTGDLIQSLIGLDVLNCIQSHVPMCQSCLPALPSVCGNLGLTVASLNVAQIGLCQSALGLFGTGIGQSCFLNAQASLLGLDLLSCLQASIPICPTKTVQPPRSLLSNILVTGCDGEPTPTTCVSALPDACRPAASGLLGTVIGLVNPLVCQTALGALGTLNAASCFVDGLLSSLTGTDLTSCLYNHLPMCDNCVSRLPSACQPDSGLTAALCQVALGVYGVSTAATCFVGGVLEAVVGQDLTDCLNALLPYCATTPLETITQIGGDVAYTSTVTSTANLLGLLDGPATTFVVVNQPASPVDLRTSTRTGGTALYTTTMTLTGNLFGFLDITTTTYIVVNIPTRPAVLNTITQTSGTTDFTSTVTSTIDLLGLLDVAYTTYVLVNQAVPTTPLSTSTRTSGSVNFTSTVTSTENLLGLLNGATTTYVLVNEATPTPTLSTSTQSSGSVAFTSTVTSAIGGLLGLLPTPTTYVLVNQPTISTSTTTFIGSMGYTSTITSTQITEIPFTLVLVGVPTALPTTTIRSGTADGPFTQTLGIGLSAIVQVVVPTTPPVLVSSFTTFVGSTEFTSTVTSTIPGLLGLLPVTTTFVLVGVPVAMPTTTITSGSLPQYTTTVGVGVSATVQIVVPTPPPVLATSTTTFVGSIPFTSTVTVVNPGLLGLLPSTTTFVLVGVPTTLPSPAITSDSLPDDVVVPPGPPELATSTTTFVGLIPFTSTVTVVNPGLLGLLPSTTTFVLVGVPTTPPLTPIFDSVPAYIIEPPGPSELVTSTITYVGSETYTRTLTVVNPGLLGLLPSTITYVLVGIPTTLPTTTITSGSAPQFTTTVGVGIAATIQIVVPTPPPTLSTSYTTFVGSVGYTSTATVVNPGLLGLLPTTTTFVVIGVPTTLPTTTVTSGSAAQFTTTVGAGIAATVKIVVPTPPPALPVSYTTVTGSVGYTSTVTSVKPGLLGLLPSTTTFVLIGVPRSGATGVR